MRIQASANAPDGGHPPPRRRVLKTTLIVLATLLLGMAAVVFAWASRRYQQAVELTRHANEQYGALNHEFPFTPPAAGKAFSEARWQALLRVRRRILDQASPELRQALHALLGADSLKSPAVYRELLAGLPLLARTLEEQISALRAEQMSAAEYQWMVGLAIREALGGREHVPAGQGYWGVLEQLARLAREGAGDKVDPGAVNDFFQKTYSGAPGPGPQVLAELQSPDKASYALDLLLASAQWAAAEGQSPAGIMRRLLPQR